jgi:hypothetical protein
VSLKKSKRALTLRGPVDENPFRAMATGPNTGLEIFIPGRQDNSERTKNPEIRSANLSVASLIYFRTSTLQKLNSLRVHGSPKNFTALS